MDRVQRPDPNAALGARRLTALADVRCRVLDPHPTDRESGCSRLILGEHPRMCRPGGSRRRRGRGPGGRETPRTTRTQRRSWVVAAGRSPDAVATPDRTGAGRPTHRRTSGALRPMPRGHTRARGTPRIANRLLRRVRDYAEVRADGVITQAVAGDALALFEVDESSPAWTKWTGRS